MNYRSRTPLISASGQLCLFLILDLTILLSTSMALAQTSGFTYQGRLTDGGTPANGNYDLQFALWDSQDGGTQVGSTQTVSTVAVSSGIFTVRLDFGASAFPGANRFLEISSRLSGAASFTLLTPRQQITSTPYAVRSLNASSADAVVVNGVPSGSGNYIQNTTSPQSSSNFNISGNGTAGGTLSGNVVNATTEYDIGGSRVLSSAGVNNLFAGANAGQSNTTGFDNSFFGTSAGLFNTTASNNSFFGNNAGRANTTADHNSFFGRSAGFNNTTGSENSFFGADAGRANTTSSSNAFFGFAAGFSNTFGIGNSFFGARSGVNNTSGASNAFFGQNAGQNNTSGDSNAFFGQNAGQNNTTGNDNTIVGLNAGNSNTTENNNTFIGASANGAAGVTNATAIGANASVTQSNSVVLGSGTNVGIGTTAPSHKLEVSGGGFQKNVLISDDNTTATTLDLENKSATFFGTLWRLQTVGGGTAGRVGNFEIWETVRGGNALTIKENSNNVGIGTTTPQDRLDVNGIIRVSTLGAAGATSLCSNASNQISTCSSSLRYKTGLHPFSAGLKIINRLHPITFRWKTDRTLDLGLGAEDVAAVEPLLVTHNAKGEIEGVKYDRLSAVFINAFKEQQAQIARQQAQAKQQQEQIAALHAANAALNARLRAIERALSKKQGPARRHR